MQDHSSDRDRELDALLAARAAVEPRPGLEQRVLANLRANGQVAGARNAWRSPAIALVAVAMVIAAGSHGWLSKKPSTVSPTGSGISAPRFVAESSRALGSAQADNGPGAPEPTRSTRPSSAGVIRQAASARRPTQMDSEAAPKLEQFPAPEPLSEQEKLLVRFVQYDPREAALVAEERAEQFQREEEEMNELREESEGLQQ